jgi:hypothetical protein
MTIDEFEEYAKAHDYVIFTRQQYEHVIDVFNAYELLLFDYYGRLKVDRVAMLGNIRAEIEEYKSRQLTLTICVADLEKGKQIALEYVLAILDKYKADPVSQESEVEDGNDD